MNDDRDAGDVAAFDQWVAQRMAEDAAWRRARALALVGRGPWPPPQNMWERCLRSYAAAHPGSLAEEMVRRGDAARLERSRRN